MKIRRILVAVDYSECSRRALLAAGDLGRRLGASLDVLHVWSEPAYLANVPEARHEHGERPLAERIRDYARQDMDDFASGTALPEGLPVTWRLACGEPAKTVLEELRRGQHDWLVLGTHGRTGLSRLLLGSVAERLVRLSPVPVLTVPQPKAD